MNKDYKQSKAERLLNDDYFVESMVNPTPESNRFWQMEIEENRIDADEFIAAYAFIEELKQSKWPIEANQKEVLWKRISASNQLRQRKRRLLKWFSIAAIFTLPLIFALTTLFNHRQQSNVSNLSEAKEMVASPEKPGQQIELITAGRSIVIDGTEPDIAYDANGKLKVDKHNIAQQSGNTPQSSEMPLNQLKVPYGKRAYLTLSDGTLLWVNAGTTVVYPQLFNGNTRTISVDGEVYADVAHNASRPFIIKTRDVEIRVLGTTFNVAAYNTDHRTDVVLEHGSVNIEAANGESTQISPNQLYSYADRKGSVSEVDVTNHTSWRHGIYQFKGEPIEAILLRLSRYYDVTINLPHDASGIRCSGKLELKENFDTLMEGLSEISAMSYSVKGNEYCIRFDDPIKETSSFIR